MRRLCDEGVRSYLGRLSWSNALAPKALDNFKARIRQLTRRSGGGGMGEVVEKLRPYLLG